MWIFVQEKRAWLLECSVIQTHAGFNICSLDIFFLYFYLVMVTNIVFLTPQCYQFVFDDDDDDDDAGMDVCVV